jgi:hypothetical protein
MRGHKSRHRARLFHFSFNELSIKTSSLRACEYTTFLFFKQCRMDTGGYAVFPRLAVGQKESLLWEQAF